MTLNANVNKKITAPDGTDFQAGTVVQDDRKKLAELQAMILSKGAAERERTLKEARAQSETWLSQRAAELDAAVESIRRDAALRAQEITTRLLVEAETARNKARLRLQSELVRQALTMFQNELAALSNRSDYDAILTGLAAEVCEKMTSGRIGLRLNKSDSLLGEGVARALNARFTQLTFYFDETPEPILGGIVLFSEQEKWRVFADWKSKVEEMTEAVAAAVLTEL